jgi:hypothetical protein
VKAAVALRNCEFCRVKGAAVGQQELDLLGKYRIAAPREPHGAIGAVNGSAELLRMATAKEQRLLAEPEAAEQAHLCQHYLVGAAERALQGCAQ